MIDWHCHILPGLDDGSRDFESSLNMAVALSDAGFAEVYCTPHLMRGCYEASNTQVCQGVAELQQHLDDAGIQLQLKPSREYFLDEYLKSYLEDPLPLGDARSILVEIPPRTSGEMVRQFTYDLVRSGFKPVIAHPERCHLLEPAVRRADSGGLFSALKRWTGKRDHYKQEHDLTESTGNSLLDYLRDIGCSFQGNLGSFSGFYGRQVKVVAEALRKRGVYDRYGSDLHAPEQAVQVLRQPAPR